MPCRDAYDDNPALYYGAQLNDKQAEIKRLQSRLSFAESSLCGALDVIEKYGNTIADVPDPLELIDYIDRGIDPAELRTWYEEHKAKDAQHRQEAANARKFARAEALGKKHRAEARAKALAKLTPEERQLLKVKE